MKELRELICPACIFLDIVAQDKFDAIRQIVLRLAALRMIPDPEVFTAEVIKRETEIATGLQWGTALPHARSKVVKEIVMAFARLEKGVDFGAADQEPARLIFLFGVPNDQINDYLKLVSKLCKLLKQRAFRKKLLAAQDVAEVLQLLKRR